MSLGDVVARPGLDQQAASCLGPAALSRLRGAAVSFRALAPPWDAWLASWAPPDGVEAREAAAKRLLREAERRPPEGWGPFLETMYVLTETGRPQGLGGTMPEHNLLDLAVERSLRVVIPLLRMRGYSLELLDAYSLESLVQEDRGEAVAAYLEAGMPPDAQANAGRTALMVAMAFQARVVAPLLLRWGADVNRPSGFGRWTALMWAAHVGWTAGCQLLLSSGAELCASNAQGLTALDIASRQGHEATAEFLCSAAGAPA